MLFLTHFLTSQLLENNYNYQGLNRPKIYVAKQQRHLHIIHNSYFSISKIQHDHQQRDLHQDENLHNVQPIHHNHMKLHHIQNSNKVQVHQQFKHQNNLQHNTYFLIIVLSPLFVSGMNVLFKQLQYYLAHLKLLYSVSPLNYQIRVL